MVFKEKQGQLGMGKGPEAVRHGREISNAGRLKLDFAERYHCKPVRFFWDSHWLEI
jgi:hypothetical protein